MHTEATLANHIQLRASIAPPGDLHAFYLYRNGEVVSKTSYKRLSTHSFLLESAGRYVVKGFRKEGEKVESSLTLPLNHTPLPEVVKPRRRKRIAVVGIHKSSAFVANILSHHHDMVAYVDPTGKHVGETFFGLPVLATPPDDTELIGHEFYRNQFAQIDTFTMEIGADDFFTRELYRHGAMELHKMARSAHFDGFTEEAFYIQNLIFLKYNSRIPFYAQIGEGTRLGIGGIGAVIHPDSIIGKGCTISQNVTLGGRAGGNGPPRIGNNVFIGPGSVLFGGNVGDNVVIGANSLVLDELPSNCVVAGSPARIISREIQNYRNYTHQAVRPGR